MLRSYRTLAETGRVLGVSAQKVRELIEHGPLNGVERPEGLMVHDEDLVAFRRPLPLSTSELESYSAFCKLFPGDNQGSQRVSRSLHVATGRDRAAAKNTPASAGFRALQDLEAVRTASDRFDRLVSPEPTSGCLLWAGAVDHHGYGFFRLGGAVVFAHRFSLTRAEGLIAEGLEVDHLCLTKSCVNDRHLEAVTVEENYRRRDARLAGLGTHNLAAAHAATAARRHLRLVQP